MSKSEYTPFRIYDKKFFDMVRAVANQEDKNLGEFMWDSVKEVTNKLSKKHHNKVLYGIIETIQPPKSIYDKNGWCDYVNSLDKKDWQKFDKIASYLIDLTNIRRSALLKKYGQL